MLVQPRSEEDADLCYIIPARPGKLGRKQFILYDEEGDILFEGDTSQWESIPGDVYDAARVIEVNPEDHPFWVQATSAQVCEEIVH